MKKKDFLKESSFYSVISFGYINFNSHQLKITLFYINVMHNFVAYSDTIKQTSTQNDSTLKWKNNLIKETMKSIKQHFCNDLIHHITKKDRT